ncbi:PfkB family carbohydrate kinase, partial [Erwinia amylovora]|uniref:PfkB family carbohydrate kinase n=1 Tax=Erwinia amylovora TaxID=552 RepID=UPI0020BE5ED8
MKNTGKLNVIGSIIADNILNLAQFPRPVETVIGKQYQVAFGGIGANLAVAAARRVADMAFIDCVGEDDMGERIRL